MIQFNLLPDIKQQYIKAQRTRRLISGISVLVTIVAVVLVVISYLGTEVVQKNRLSSANNNVQKDTAAIKNVPNLSSVLTVQSQLESLPSLDSQKHAASQLFTYLKQTTPNAAYINDLTIDFTQDTITITGTADTLDTVNTYVDTLKHAEYTSTNSSSPQPAFSAVTLSSFGRSDQGAQYTITLTYDPNIFDITQTVNMNVPNVNVTRLGVANPNALFQDAPKDQGSPSSSTGAGQ